MSVLILFFCHAVLVRSLLKCPYNLKLLHHIHTLDESCIVIILPTDPILPWIQISGRIQNFHSPFSPPLLDSMENGFDGTKPFFILSRSCWSSPTWPDSAFSQFTYDGMTCPHGDLVGRSDQFWQTNGKGKVGAWTEHFSASLLYHQSELVASCGNFDQGAIWWSIWANLISVPSGGIKERVVCLVKFDQGTIWWPVSFDQDAIWWPVCAN